MKLDRDKLQDDITGKSTRLWVKLALIVCSTRESSGISQGPCARAV